MQHHGFGSLGPVSILTLGGGGLGGVWGETSVAECISTVHAAVDAGITLFDLAPSYGAGRAEEVVGAAFDGKLPRACASPANAGSATRRRRRSKGCCASRSRGV